MAEILLESETVLRYIPFCLLKAVQVGGYGFFHLVNIQMKRSDTLNHPDNSLTKTFKNFHTCANLSRAKHS